MDAADRIPAHADESLVPAYTLPDPLRDADGAAVTAAGWPQQRSHLLDRFSALVYGHTPAVACTVDATVVEQDVACGGLALRRQVRVELRLAGGVVPVDLLLHLPRAATGPVPVFLGLNFSGNHSLHPDPAIRLAPGWVFAGSSGGHRAGEADRSRQAQRHPVEMALARGYGLASACYGDLEPDHPEGWRDGVRGVLGRSEGPEAWGAIGVWAWGLSRLLDALLDQREVDARRVAVFGHSRLGKAALWAAAQDQRFALAVSNESGCGGAALHRRRLGETIAHVTTRFPHWFCPTYATYAGRDGELPIDQHQLLALIAPRPLAVGSALEDWWADPRGEWTSCRHAAPAWDLLGHPAGLGGYPEPGASTGERLRHHLRGGAHDLTAIDWWRYLDLADAHLR